MKINGVNITSGTQEVEKPTGKDRTQETPSGGSSSSSVTGKTDENSLVDVKLDSNSSIEETISSVEQQQQQQMQTLLQQLQSLMTQLSDLGEQQQNLSIQLMSNSSGDITSFMSSYQNLANQKNQIYTNITNTLVMIKQFEEQMATASQATQDLLGQLKTTTNSLADMSGYNSLAGTSGANLLPNIDSNTQLGAAMVSLGNSFVGNINSDAQGNQAFSGGANRPWCADFVTSIVRRACEATGKEAPRFPASSVSGILSWGQQNGRFIQIAGQANRGQLIASNIKPGDIMIQKENDASHTGIVTKVYPDGSFDTVEGNTSNAVKNRHYPADHNRLTGFVRVT